MERDENEDLIEATIRRVAASKAARLEPDELGGDEHRAPTLHLVPPTDPQAGEPRAPASARPPIDESAIEATLRRIETEQRLRAAESLSPTEFEGEPDESEIGESGVAQGGLHPVLAEAVLEAAPHRIEFPRDPVGSDSSSWEHVAQDLRRELEETKKAIRSLAARVDALTGSASHQETRTEQGSGSAARTFAPDAVAAEDDWDDTPQLPRIPLGTPPRRGISFDPSPATATAAQLGHVEGAPQLSPLQRGDEAPPMAAAAGAKHGFDLLPRTYRITVEDKRRGVDLVPLHRALLGMEGVREMSLLSYSNGTAIVALETTTELFPDALGSAVSHAMAREVKVEVHNEQTMVIKLAED